MRIAAMVLLSKRMLQLRYMNVGLNDVGLHYVILHDTGFEDVVGSVGINSISGFCVSDARG